MKARRQSMRALKLVIIGVVAMVIVAYCLVSSYSIRRPVPFQREKMTAAVNLALAARSAIVLLPPQLAGLSATRRAYVTRLDDGSRLVFLPSWMGRDELMGSTCALDIDDWIEGYLWSERPLNVHQEDPSLIINVPYFSNPWDAKRDAGVQDIVMFFFRQVAPHWYYTNSFS